MNRFEVLSQTNIGESREVDGQRQRPLRICNVALTTPFSHEHYPLPLFSLTGAVSRLQPDLHEMTLARALGPEEIIAFVRMNKPDILALSAPQKTLETLDKTLAYLAQFAPEETPQIILGSSLPTYLSGRFFKKNPELPMIIVGGWGEGAFAEEVKSRSIQNPKPQQKFINGTYPEDYPKQEGVPKKGAVIFHYPRVEASKGCFWGACSYCLRPWNEKQGRWKQYQPEDVLSQITDLLKLGYTSYFEFADEEPVSTNMDKLQQIMEGLAEMKRGYPDLTFGMNMRADHVISPDPNRQEQYDGFLRKAKDAGLTVVWMGAESYSYSQLQRYNKGPNITPDTNLEAAKKLYNLGIDVLQGFIPYDPLSKWQELVEMANFMEPRMPFLSKVLASPFGFLRVQHNTQYLEAVQRFESTTNHRLLSSLDEDTLTYRCRYQDPSIGLHVSYMRLVYDWINPPMKQMNVEALKGDIDSKYKLDKLRLAGLRLFIKGIKRLEPLKEDLAELQEEQLRIIDEYKREVHNLGIDITGLDEFIQENLVDYLCNFMGGNFCQTQGDMFPLK